MKFTVECAYRTLEMIAASEHTNQTMDCIGETVEANSAEEAIEIAMDYIVEQVIANSNLRAEIKDESVVELDDDDNIVGEYYRFSAKEV